MGGQMLQPATMQAVAWRRAAASSGCRAIQSRETMQTCLKMGRLVRKQMHKRQQKQRRRRLQRLAAHVPCSKKCSRALFRATESRLTSASLQTNW